jgi:protein required for attachment to host cells
MWYSAGARKASMSGLANLLSSNGRHAMPPQSTGQEKQISRFARHIAEFPNEAVAESEIKNLVILAAPGVPGYLRSDLSDTVLRAVVPSEALNLVNFKPPQIRKYFE